MPSRNRRPLAKDNTVARQTAPPRAAAASERHRADVKWRVNALNEGRLPDLSGVPDKPSGRRSRRTQDEVLWLEAAIYRVLDDDHPQSVRHVFYRMTDPRLGPLAVPKTDRGYKHVQDRITKMRRAELIPYGWISDATRRGYFVDTFTGPGDFLNRVAALYRADIWADADTYVEVWCESRSIAGVIEAECRRLAVPLYPCGGFASLTLTYEAAEHIRKVANGRAVQIVFIGDYDPAGVLIDERMMDELTHHLPDFDIEEERIAITKEQADSGVLPSKPRNAKDARRPEIERTIEAEAMEARELRRLLTDAVERLLPPWTLAAAKVVEESEREGLIALAEAVYGEGRA